MLTPADLLDTIFQAVDDVSRIHSADPLIGLRALSRAHQWVALRYRLLRRIYPWALRARVPLYARMDVCPRAVAILGATLNGEPLWPTPLDAVRYRDTQWLATQGTPALWYKVRWSYLGVYPVPSTAQTGTLTAIAAPLPLTLMTQALETPDGYADQLILTTTGLLLIGRERAVQEGLGKIAAGLNLTPAQARKVAANVPS